MAKSVQDMFREKLEPLGFKVKATSFFRRSYAWSPGGLLNLTQDESGHSTDYLYDATGQLIGIWATNYDFLAFSHDAGGRLTEKWFPNGTTARYVYPGSQ
jgi:YD repeat-containing protein